MAVSQEPIILATEQVQDIERRLSSFRHNINNHLALIVAAVELMRRKPDLVMRMADTISDQPPKVLREIQELTDGLEKLLHIERTPRK